MLTKVKNPATERPPVIRPFSINRVCLTTVGLPLRKLATRRVDLQKHCVQTIAKRGYIWKVWYADFMYRDLLITGLVFRTTDDPLTTQYFIQVPDGGLDFGWPYCYLLKEH
jgi:hypothetical protein